MPTIIGILSFMSMIDWMFNWVEHEKLFYNLGPVQEILVLIKHDLSHPFSMDA